MSNVFENGVLAALLFFSFFLGAVLGQTGTVAKERDEAIVRAERAESDLLRVTRLANDEVLSAAWRVTQALETVELILEAANRSDLTIPDCSRSTQYVGGGE